MQLYTSGDYLASVPDWHMGDSGWKAAQVLRMLDRHELDPERVAEVGCGAGGILKALARSRPEIRELDGFDIAPDAVSLAARDPEPRVRIRCADFLAQPEQARWDLLLVMDVAEHVPDPLDFLRLLRPRAERLIIHLPLDMSVFGLLTGIPMRRRITVGHLHYFCKDTALATLRDAGYKVVDWFYTTSAVDRASSRDSMRRRAINLARRSFHALDPDRSVLLFGGCSLLVLAEPEDDTPPADRPSQEPSCAREVGGAPALHEGP